MLTFISGVDAQTETSAEVFVLEPAGLEVGDESSALAGWSRTSERETAASSSPANGACLAGEPGAVASATSRAVLLDVAGARDR